MNPYIVEATDITPEVIFDPQNNRFELLGESRPESVREFYQPIIDWLNQYAKEIQQLDAKQKESFEFNIFFKLDYFNSSSAKYFLDIIKGLISNFHNNGLKIKVNWQYEEGDEDMQEAGEELSHMVKFPFKYIAIKSNYPD